MLAVGCAAEPEGTRGQLGNLRFAYTCAGCDFSSEVLVGSALDIRVERVNPKVKYAVRSASPEIAVFTSTTHCTFVGQDDCHEGVHAEMKRAGNVDLEMIDAWTETVLDRVTVKVRDAASIESTVRANGQALSRTVSGAYEVPVGSQVEIDSVARSASGAPLIATTGALHGAYADDMIVGPEYVEETIEYAKAKRPGSTTVSRIGSGAKEELPFVVR
jgi:hypothetical protein